MYNKNFDWYPPKNYSPNLSVEDWKKLLQDEEIFSVEDLQIVKRFQDYDCQGTFAQIAYAYGEDENFYKEKVSALGKKISAKTNCPVFEGNYKNILFLERAAGKYVKHGEKIFYALREELVTALNQVDLSNIKIYTAEKIAKKINFDKTERGRKINKNSVGKLEFAFCDKENRKIPIESYLGQPCEDDSRGYYICLNKNDNRIADKFSAMGFKKLDNRLTDDVATKLLAKDLAYQVPHHYFDDKKLLAARYTPISAEEYKKVVAELTE